MNIGIGDKGKILKPISGSCGGVAAALGEQHYVCDICGGDQARCAETNMESVATTQSTDVYQGGALGPLFSHNNSEYQNRVNRPWIR